MNGEISIIKAGVGLRKRVGGSVVYVSGKFTDSRQFQVQKQFATLQNGLDSMGLYAGQVLGSIGDLGFTPLYRWWDAQYDSVPAWVTWPGPTVSAEGVGPLVQHRYAGGGFLHPVYVDLWDNRIQRLVRYQLVHDGSVNQATFAGSRLVVDPSGVLYTRFVYLLNVQPTQFVTVLEGDMRIMLGELLTLKRTFIAPGVSWLDVQYRDAFSYPQPYPIWHNEPGDTNAPGSFVIEMLNGGTSPKNGKRDVVFR